ncbi:MAG: threonylcarbamoyl-AMP synthase [Lachnospiraceae bacterium]|nr:threonylcarbamoyl-AMP synthase [Lachnospiraceae bacterium]
MNTIYAKTDPDDIDMSVIEKAGSIVKQGGLVAFPTETVYGLGADALCGASSKKIYEAKGRPSDNPLIIHIAELEDIYRIVKIVPPEALALAKRYWPGPLTMIFDKASIVPKETTGGLDTVAVRFPSHPVAKAFIKAAGGFVAAPSANLSGRPSPTTGKHVAEDMEGRIDMIIDSGPCDIGLESTIIDMTSDVPMMLRPGYVNEEMLRDVLGDIEKDPAVFGNTDENILPKAPGMKYRHYAPKGRLSIVSGESDKVTEYIRARIASRKEGVRIGVIASSSDVSYYGSADLVADAGSRTNETEIAARLFDILRRCDEERIDEIYSEEFNTPQLGLAIMNRLIKAAGHSIIKV